ncbi:HTH_Tnp_Tc3_2 domain-containing protein [Trichonephila clavipes]|nr:HTH_Tnp_Tc3_2 domain-containing protein [Trichonephila clavipes]
MINGRTRLHVVANGTMTGQRYIDEVLLPHVRLFRGAVGDKFVFMDDNANKSSNTRCSDCQDSEGIQRLNYWTSGICGRTLLEVSEELRIAQSVISRLWQRFQDDGNVSRCYSTGRPRVTTPNEDRYLAVTAKRIRRRTASDLSRQLSSATGTTVSRQTVYRRLGHIGLYAGRPGRCVPLTATHCRLQLSWSREPALWTPQQWSCVMFSDESRFSLQSDSRRTLIWRVPGTRYHTKITPWNDTVTVVQDGSFGEDLFLFPKLACKFRVQQ